MKWLAVLVAVAVIVYWKIRSAWRKAAAENDARLDALFHAKVRASLKGRTNICTRCGLRPKENNSTMCEWCGI